MIIRSTDLPLIRASERRWDAMHPRAPRAAGNAAPGEAYIGYGGKIRSGLPGDYYSGKLRNSYDDRGNYFPWNYQIGKSYRVPGSPLPKLPPGFGWNVTADLGAGMVEARVIEY